MPLKIAYGARQFFMPFLKDLLYTIIRLKFRQYFMTAITKDKGSSTI